MNLYNIYYCFTVLSTVTVIALLSCPINRPKTRLLPLLWSWTKYDHELTLHKIATTRTWYCMCVLCLTMCIFGCLWNWICAHGYQSVSYEGLNTHMGKWQTVQGKHIIFYVWKNLTSKSNYLDVGYIHFYKCIVDLDDHVFSEMHYLHALNFRKVIKSMSKNFIV